MVVILSASLTPAGLLIGIAIAALAGFVLSRGRRSRGSRPPRTGATRDQRPGGASGPAGTAFGQAGAQPGSPDLFQMMDAFFGGSAGPGARPGVQRGGDVEVDLAVGADEVVSGAVRELRVATLVACAACGGGGAAPGTGVEPCDLCEGRGEIQAEIRSLLGSATPRRRCARCDGFGSLVSRPCRDCGGSGRAAGERTVRFRVPAGVRDGTRVRLAGQGEAGARGAPPGDAYVRIQVPVQARAAGAGAAAAPPPRPATAAEPLTIRTARLEFTADRAGFVVRNRRGPASEPWVTHLRASWAEVDSMEFDVDRHDEVVALYVRTTSGDRRYVMDSPQLTAEQWTALAGKVAESTGGRLTLDLSRRRQGPYRPGP